MSNILRKIKRFLQWNYFLKKNKFRNDTWYFVLNYGIGDTYVVCSLAKYILEKYINVQFIIEKSNHRFMANLFHDKIIIADINVPHNLIKEFGQFSLGQPIMLHPIYLLNTNLVQIIGYKSFSLVDMYKALLGINMLCIPSKPMVSSIYTNEAYSLFNKYGLSAGDTVILCPNANSIAQINDEFWIVLAEKLSHAGLFPVVLGKNIGSYRTIEFPLECAINFIEMAGYFISLRSGFCDSVSTAEAKKIVIYPNEIWFSGQLVDSTSLSIMGLSEDVNEFVINIQNMNVEKETSKILTLLGYDL